MLSSFKIFFRSEILSGEAMMSAPAPVLGDFQNWNSSLESSSCRDKLCSGLRDDVRRTENLSKKKNNLISNSHNYSRSLLFADFLIICGPVYGFSIAYFMKEFGFKMVWNWLFSSIQFSLIISGFSIRGSLIDRTYLPRITRGICKSIARFPNLFLAGDKLFMAKILEKHLKCSKRDFRIFQTCF